MKFNFKNNETILTIIVLVGFILFKYVPKNIKVFLLIFLGLTFLFNLAYLIYKRSYWEEIIRVAVLLITLIGIFIAYYKSAFSFDDSFMNIALLLIGWMFPLLAYTGVISLKRQGEKDKYKRCLLLLLYSIALAVFCSLVVIFKH